MNYITNHRNKLASIAAGVLLFALIFSAYAMAATSQPSRQAVGTTASTMQELQAESRVTPAVKSDTQADVKASVTVTPAPAVAQPSATAQPPRAVAKPQAPQTPAPAAKAPQDTVGAAVRETVSPVFNDSGCQYPGRLTNVHGCDNSDPCDPSTLKDPKLTGACRN